MSGDKINWEELGCDNPSDIKVTEKEFNEFFDNQKSFVESMLKEKKHDSFSSMVVVMGREVEKNAKSEVTVFCLAGDISFDEHEEKHAVMRRLGKIYYEMKMKKAPLILCFMSEAWMSMVVDKEKIDSGDFVRPRDDPKRKEVITVAAIAPKGNKKKFLSRYDCLEITRDKDNVISKSGDWMSKGELEESTFRSPLLESFIRGYFEVILRKYHGWEDKDFGD